MIRALFGFVLEKVCRLWLFHITALPANKPAIYNIASAKNSPGSCVVSTEDI